MSNTPKNQYQPDSLVTPGEVLEDYIDNLGMTQVELASRTGLAKKTINEIIKGKTPITRPRPHWRRAGAHPRPSRPFHGTILSASTRKTGFAWLNSSALKTIWTGSIKSR